MDKLVEKIAEIIEDNTSYTAGKYSPLAGPITSSITKLLCSPKELANEILQAILSSPNIIEIDPDAKPPPFLTPSGLTEMELVTAVRKSYSDAGWVKRK